ncbi:MAG TPA: replication-relaxation family protein [Thermoanaerobaculia bacterium]|jgi:hypothetical protein|nr:replication-relaxation family protein [Thermoanaerobaculia bacterium]
MHDPRRVKAPSSRDIKALTFIGEGFEVAQYQLHVAIFPSVSAVVVSHFVTRAVRNGWINIERWNGVGINRLRLAAAGRELAVRAGGDERSLFIPKRAVAPKDVPHTLWINDARIALLLNGSCTFDVVLPAWQLQRRLSPAPTAIPDVLAIRNGSGDAPALLLACEIDLGGERLAGTFLPKLKTLHSLLSEWRGSGTAQILVLTRGIRRAQLINSLAEADGLALVATCLPQASGPGGLASMRAVVEKVLSHAVNTS